MGKNRLVLRWPVDGPHKDHWLVRNIRTGSNCGRRVVTQIYRCQSCHGALVHVGQVEDHR